MPIYTHPRPSTPVPGLPYPLQGPLYPSQTFHTHPRLSRSVPGPFTNSRSFTSIPAHTHTSDTLHYHKSFQCPSHALHTHLSHLHPSPPLQTQPKPFTPISGPPYPSLAIPNLSWPFKLTLGPPPQYQALLAYPRPSKPSPNLPYHPRLPRSVPEPPPHPSQPIQLI